MLTLIGLFASLVHKIRTSPDGPQSLEDELEAIGHLSRGSSMRIRKRSNSETVRKIQAVAAEMVYPTAQRRLRRRNTKWLPHEQKGDARRMTVNRLPAEALVDAMGFLSRDDLDVLQLTSARFDELVEDYFPAFPLRAVHSFTLRSTRRSRKTRIRIVCIPLESGGAGSENRILQADEDPHLWLHRCAVQTVKFENFSFTLNVLAQLATLEAHTTHISFVVLEYEDAGQLSNLDSSVTALFSNAAFRSCKGAVFRFDPDCASYRPSIPSILRPNLAAIVIDYEDFECDTATLEAIVSWLSEGHNQRVGTSKSLSIKGMDVDEDELTKAIDRLKKEFLESHCACAWILNTDFETDVDIEENLANDETGEKLTIVSSPEQPLRILRE